MTALKNFFIYSLGNLLLKIISAIITFSSITFLNPEQFGQLALLNTYIWVLPIFLNLGLRQVFSLEFFHKNNLQRKEIIVDIIAIYLVFASFVCFFLLANLNTLNKCFFLNQVNFFDLLIATFIGFIYFFVELFFLILKYLNKALNLIIVQIYMAISNALFAIILIYFYKLKITGILIANLLSMMLICIYSLYLYVKKIGYISFNVLTKKDKILYYLKYGLPYIPSIFFNWLMSFGDRWVLAHYNNLHTVGIYSFADSFGQLYQSLIVIPLTAAYLPYIFQKFADDKNNILEIDKTNYKYMWKFLAIMLSITIFAFACFKKLFYIFLPINYHNSVNYILLIIIEQIIFSCSYFASCYLIFLKKIHLTISAIIFASILNLLLNLWLIPIYSIHGAIVSTIIAYSLYLILIMAFTKYVKKGTLCTRSTRAS